MDSSRFWLIFHVYENHNSVYSSTSTYYNLPLPEINNRPFHFNCKERRKKKISKMPFGFDIENNER